MSEQYAIQHGYHPGTNVKYIKKSNRKWDMRAEQIVRSYVSQLYTAHGFEYAYTDMRDMQIGGVDVSLIDVDREQYYVDEKAAISRLDGSLNTFAFEVCTKNNPSHTGWLLNPLAKNTHYGLIYMKSKANDVNQIDKMEVFIVDKDDIINEIDILLSGSGIQMKNLENIAKNGRESHGKRYISLAQGAKIVYSENIIPEQPVNILIPKDTLQEYSAFIMYGKFRNTLSEEGVYEHKLYYYDERINRRSRWFDD